MNPQQHEVHDLPSNTSSTVGSPHGNLLMSGLCLSLCVVLSHAHTHTEVKNLTLRSHTIISSPFSPSEGLWLRHRGASDLSWECNEHQPRPPHPVSGSRPKWHVVWFSTCYTTQERHLAKQRSSPCLLMRPWGQKKTKNVRVGYHNMLWSLLCLSGPQTCLRDQYQEGLHVLWATRACGPAYLVWWVIWRELEALCCF